MLARLWEGSEATSIWVEIVAERKQEILATFGSTGNIDIAAHQATLDDLERYRLAEWDASARAWLRTADLRNARQQTQLELVIRNFQIPVNSKPVLYESVLQAWKVALTGMENLLQGSPQQVQSGELLLGLAAWHLYPDMVVLSNSTKSIEQKDPLFGGGVLTFGLSGNTLSMESGVHWSLPLAYLRYYGDPVIRTRAMTEDGSRLSADDLSKAVLGCVLEGWGSDGEDTLAASKFILDLSEKVSEALSTDPQRSQAILEHHCSPLATLAKAASELLSSQGGERRRSLQLIRLGRRSADFLGPTCSGFGLLRSGFYLSVQSSPNEKISALRRLVKDLNVESEDIFIKYSRRLPETGEEVWECATALPIPRRSVKRTANRAEKIAEGHCRWIVTQLELAHSEPESLDLAHSEPKNPEFPNKHFADRFQKQTLEHHTNMIHQGENLFAKEAEIISCRQENGEEIIYWYQPYRSLLPTRLIKHDLTFVGLDYQRWIQDTNPGTRFEMLYGDMQAAVFVACPNQFDPPLNKPQLPPNAERSGIHHYLLNESLDSALFLQMCDEAFQSTGSDYMLSLQGFATAVQLYMLMPDASIDVSIFATARSLSGATAKTFSDPNLRENAFSSTLAKVCKKIGCQQVPLIAWHLFFEPSASLLMHHHV